MDNLDENKIIEDADMQDSADESKEPRSVSNKEFALFLLKKFWNTFNWAIITILVFVITFKFILFGGVVPSESMETTISKTSLCFGNRLDNDYTRGDIVIFIGEDGQYLVKRIIGVGGDVISIEDGVINLNGSVLQEDYVMGTTKNPKGDIVFKVPENCLFMMGDNRENSLDSRYWNNPYINEEDVICTVFSYIPFDDPDKPTWFTSVK